MNLPHDGQVDHPWWSLCLGWTLHRQRARLAGQAALFEHASPGGRTRRRCPWRTGARVAGGCCCAVSNDAWPVRMQARTPGPPGPRSAATGSVVGRACYPPAWMPGGRTMKVRAGIFRPDGVLRPGRATTPIISLRARPCGIPTSGTA
jgi:hypothetical protein